MATTSFTEPDIDTKTLAATIARIVEEKKGVDLAVYDVSETIKVADYFVVVTGTSRPHVRAMYEDVHHRLKRLGERHSRAEGADLGWWVLIDYSDVVVHIQQEEARDYYGLDDLYGDCPKLDWGSVPVDDTGALGDPGSLGDPGALGDPGRMADAESHGS